MAQTKKIEKREALLASAYKLFKDKGYMKCQMTEIARSAGTSVSNIYVYFPSKLHLFYEVYTPVLINRMIKLGNEAHQIDDFEQRLHFILLSLWRDIPSEDNGFAHNLIQAIATTPPEQEKPHNALRWCEEFLHDLIQECLSEERRYLVKDTMISFLVWMAFDGFVANIGKNEDRDIDSLAHHFSDMLLGQGSKRENLSAVND